MMDNEQPWQPPEQVRTHPAPKVILQVPEVTLFSPSNKLPAINRPNFLQRAIASDKVLNVQKQPPAKSPQMTMASQMSYDHTVPSKPSVPDVSLLEPQALNPVNRMTQQRPRSSPSNQVFQKPLQSSKENIFDAIGKHSVPDVTILEEPKPQPAKTSSSDRVFSESYQNMLVNTHEEFMKQFKAENPPAEEPTTVPKKRSGLFNPQPVRYQENPLQKYAPKPPPVKRKEPNPNSSSILIEFDDTQVPQADTEEKADEITFKKVAAMLSEIQKLVVPDKPTPEQAKGRSEVAKKPRKADVLRRLAFEYLTPEELHEFDVENDLMDLDKSECEDSS